MALTLGIIEEASVGMRDSFVLVERLKALRRALDAFTEIAWDSDNYGYKVNNAIDAMQDNVENLEAVIDSAIDDAMNEADNWYRELQRGILEN